MRNNDRNTLNSLAVTVRPRPSRWIAGAVLAFAAATAAVGEPQNTTIEECLESGTEAVSLPGVASGSLSTSPCTGCPTLRLRFDGRTRYFVGKEQVSYAKLREAAAKGDLRLDLFYEPKTRNLTRLRLAATVSDK